MDEREELIRLLTQHLVTGGYFGRVDFWYQPLKAAQYLGVPPWDLCPDVDRAVWLERAIIAMEAEERARKEIARQPVGRGLVEKIHAGLLSKQRREPLGLGS